jgi:poly-beta-1,6-N-acetyl-D-glucosamine synthase
MHTLNWLDITILILGIINFFRLTILSTLTVVYDSFLLRKNLRHKTRKKIKVTNINFDCEYKPLVSVIIAAYNEEKVIQRTLTYLFQSSYQNFEVIVVNDGSKDRTEEKIREFAQNNPAKKINYIFQENQGKAHALNNAIFNYANGSLMMCLDADSILTKNALENSVKYFQNEKIKALATNVKIITDISLLGLIQKIEYLMGYHLKKALTVGNIDYIIGGIGSVFRTSLVKELGGYDTDTITEDIDLTMKIVKKGNKDNLLIYAEDVVVFTEGTLDLKALFRQRFRWKFGRFQTFWKNKEVFFNTDKRYTKFLTFVYLPFQLLSEFIFLFDPLFVGYIAYLAIRTGSTSSYYGMFVFMMFYVAIAIVTDYMSSAKERVILLLFTPFSYLLFFVVSIVEYCGLVRCIIQWKGIIYAKEINRCNWTPVERLGTEDVKVG